MAVAHWLFKSDPEAFTFADLLRAPKRTTGWDGIRSAEARNLLRDRVRVGDLVFVYHSNAAPSVIVGIAEVVKAAYPDPSAFRAGDPHFDAKSDPAHPTWFMVDIRAREELPRPVTLDEVKSHPRLRSMALVTRGRLSIQPVTPEQWADVLALARTAAPAAKAKAKAKSATRARK